MTRHSFYAALLAAAAMAATAPGVPAQVGTSKPVTVKQPKKKLERFKGEVLTATSVQIIVRSRTDERVIRTFSYTPEVREKMLKIIDRGGYQHGDKVEIYYQPGSDVAVKIAGKPSKPL